MKTEEVIELPEQVFNTVNVKTNTEYKKFMKNSIVIADGVEYVGDTTLTKLLYARLLCGAHNKNKLEAFQDLIESTGSRVVVFYNFNRELDALIKIIGKRPYSIVNGATRDLTKFRENDDGIALIQTQAGAEGLNLQEANHLIYFSPPLSSAKFEQSKKRIHRIGQRKTCFYYHLVSEGSIEEKIYDALAKGKDYIDQLFEED